MAHRIPVAPLINMRLQQRRVEAEVPVQKPGQVHIFCLHGGQQLHTVAGGDDHALRHARSGGKRARGFSQVRAGDGDLLAHGNGRGLIVHANERQGHWGPYLCTWLIRLAAHTDTTTKKTAPERYAALRPRMPALLLTSSNTTYTAQLTKAAMILGSRK